MRLWSGAIVAGIPDELFWELTPREVEEVLLRRAEEDKVDLRRFCLIAATIVNVNRKKGARLVKPDDFIKERSKPEDFMDPELAQAWMDRWARIHNEGLADQ